MIKDPEKECFFRCLYLKDSSLSISRLVQNCYTLIAYAAIQSMQS
jgi:hypothetical protein